MAPTTADAQISHIGHCGRGVCGRSIMRSNVAHERPSRRAKPACEGPPRWAGYASQPPANPSLVCSVLWTKERGQHALLGFELELIDIEHEHWQKKKGQKV